MAWFLSLLTFRGLGSFLIGSFWPLSLYRSFSHWLYPALFCWKTSWERLSITLCLHMHPNKSRPVPDFISAFSHSTCVPESMNIKWDEHLLKASVFLHKASRWLFSSASTRCDSVSRISGHFSINHCLFTVLVSSQSYLSSTVTDCGYPFSLVLFSGNEIDLNVSQH